MLTAQPSSNPTLLRRAFFGASELRSGWRLVIFLAIVIASINASGWMLRPLLRGADRDVGFLVREILAFARDSLPTDSTLKVLKWHSSGNLAKICFRHEQRLPHA